MSASSLFRIVSASDVMFHATISRSDHLETSPLLGTSFPDLLTKLPKQDIPEGYNWKSYFLYIFATCE